jgi:hypothetical protein
MDACTHTWLHGVVQDEALIVDFKLADNVYAKSKIPPAQNVCLWLGVSLTAATALCMQSCV